MHGTREAITSQPSTGVQNWLEANRGTILGMTGLAIAFIALGAFVVAVSIPQSEESPQFLTAYSFMGILPGVFITAVAVILHYKDQKKRTTTPVVKTTVQEEAIKRTTKDARMFLLLVGYVALMFGLGLFLTSRLALDSSSLPPNFEPSLNLCFSMSIVTGFVGAGLVVVSAATKVAEKIALALHDSSKKKAAQQSEAAFNAQVD